MSLDPDKFHLVFFTQVQQPPPQVGVQCPAAFLALPLAGTPLLCPTLLHGIRQVPGISEKLDPAGFPEEFQPGNCSHQFHAIVGGMLKSSR